MRCIVHLVSTWRQGYPKGKGYVQFSHPEDAALARKVGLIDEMSISSVTDVPRNTMAGSLMVVSATSYVSSHDFQLYH